MEFVAVAALVVGIVGVALAWASFRNSKIQQLEQRVAYLEQSLRQCTQDRAALQRENIELQRQLVKAHG